MVILWAVCSKRLLPLQKKAGSPSGTRRVKNETFASRQERGRERAKAKPKVLPAKEREAARKDILPGIVVSSQISAELFTKVVGQGKKKRGKAANGKTPDTGAPPRKRRKRFCFHIRAPKPPGQKGGGRGAAWARKKKENDGALEKNV